jgi:hypothetical protein
VGPIPGLYYSHLHCIAWKTGEKEALLDLSKDYLAAAKTKNGHRRDSSKPLLAVLLALEIFDCLIG